MDSNNLSWHNVVFLLVALVVSVNTSWLAIIPCSIAYTVLLLVIKKLTGKEIVMNENNQANAQDGSNKLATPVKSEIEPRSSLERILIGIFIGLPAGCIGIACSGFGYEILFYDKSYWGLLVLVSGLVLIFISWQILAGKTKGYTKEQKRGMRSVYPDVDIVSEAFDDND